MKLRHAFINKLNDNNSREENIPCIAEISDEEQDGMYFLFYCNNKGDQLADYCFFSLNDAKKQACADFGIRDDEWETPN